MIAQHMINPQKKYPVIEYILLPDGGEIVAYLKENIKFDKFLVYGTSIKITGKSKRPGSTQVYTEYQVVVDKIEQ